MKRGQRVTWVPPWSDRRDREHPDREHGVLVSMRADGSGAVRFKDHHGERTENVWLGDLE